MLYTSNNVYLDYAKENTNLIQIYRLFPVILTLLSVKFINLNIQSRPENCYDVFERFNFVFGHLFSHFFKQFKSCIRACITFFLVKGHSVRSL